jgi:prepilin-type N-terminal cleavage/methylation domain-containing protein
MNLKSSRINTMHALNRCLRKSARQPSGLSLIELLVVTAILGILAAILTPAIANTLRSSYKVGALNHIRQMSMFAVQYANENNGCLPEEGGEGVQSFNQIASVANSNAWYNVLPALATDRRVLPAKDYRTNTKAFYSKRSIFYVQGAKYPRNPGARAFFAYAINSQLDSSGATNLMRIPNPARTALFAGAALPDERDLLPTGGRFSDLGQPKVRDYRFVGRYAGVGIIGFADGHAELVPKNKAFDTNVVLWEVPQQ